MNTRNYSLDALRAIMMLLGIVVHATVAYTSLDVFPRPIKDSDTSIVYDFLILFIHAFRMPIFFVLSGFFTAMLYHKKGLKQTLKNRINRIVLPFIASMIVIAPLVKMLIMHYARNMSWAEVFSSVKDLTIFINLKTGHLWFLYYLIMILLVCHIIKLLKPNFLVIGFNYLKQIVDTNAYNGYKPIAFFTILSACFIIPQQQGFIDTSLNFIPDIFILLTYLVYFIFGYILFTRQENLMSIFSNWKTHLFLAFLCTVLYLSIFLYTQSHLSTLFVSIASLFCTLLSWLMIFGLMGLFLNKLNQASKTLAFISKSSYWIYLTHLPLTILLSGLLIDTPIPHIAKCLLNIFSTYFILILAYKLFVEHTFIGQFLNGKK